VTTGCAAQDDVEYGETTSAVSVGAASGGSCSTSSVRGLAIQIAREVDCASPSSLVHWASSGTIKFTSNAVLPFLHPTAKTDVVATAVHNPLRVNSGYRTVVQQYLLYRWFRAGRCGISKAALPGTSNHESGRAIDLSNWSTRVGAMAAHHWAHDVPGDPVHFDHLSSPDNRGKDVRAFQRLWNRNHPGDKIAVDGDYGPQTADRLRRAPAKGFAIGAQCAMAAGITEPALAPELDIVAIDGADQVAPSTLVHYTVAIANLEPTDYPATARLVIADGSASELYDAATWVSPSEPGPIDTVIPAHGDADIDLVLAAPAVTEETPFSATFALVDGDRRLGTFDLAMTVTPSGGADTSAEDGEDDETGDGVADEDGVVVESGCNAGGGGAGAWLAVLLLGFVMRRRGHNQSKP
jgi:uncharacterized protein (TIGR03382 family)